MFTFEAFCLPVINMKISFESRGIVSAGEYHIYKACMGGGGGFEKK